MEKARADVHRLLQEKRPMTSSEISKQKRFAWTRRTNAYELVEILREDPRLRYLRHLLFTLSDWEIEGRAYKDEKLQAASDTPEHPCT